MNCLQRVSPLNSSYSPSQARCICGIRIAFGIIAACGFSVSIGAIVSYFPPSVGYAGGSIAAVSLCALALSYIKCADETLHVQEESPLNSTTNSIEPTATLVGYDSKPLTIKDNNVKKLRKGVLQSINSQIEKPSAEIAVEPIRREKPNNAVISNRRNASDTVAPTENAHEELFEAESKFIDSSRDINESTTVSGAPNTAKLASESTREALICSDLESFALAGSSSLDISYLPQEVKLMVLRCLIPRELAAMSLTSHAWRVITLDNVLWARHCINYLIPSPKNAEALGSYARRFAKVQNLTAAIVKRESNPQIVCFDKPIYCALINNNKSFVICSDGVHMMDIDFTNTEKEIFNLRECITPDSLEIIDDVLFCFHAPDPDRSDRNALLFSYDLAKNMQIKNRTTIGLYEWEHGISKHRGGRLAFSKDKAFCNYKNGDIRVWNLCQARKLRYEYDECTDIIEYEDYNEHLRLLAERYGAHTERYKEKVIIVESLMQQQKKLGEERQIFQGHTGQITHLSVSNGHLYSSSEDGTIKIWNIETTQCMQTIITDLYRSTYDAKVLGVEGFFVNDNYIFGYTYDPKANHTMCKLWDTHTGLCLQTIQLNTCMGSYCLRGNLLFFSHQTTIHIYDLCTGQEIRAFSCDMPNDKLHVKPALAHLQVIGNKLICIGKEHELDDSGKQIFIFDLS